MKTEKLIQFALKQTAIILVVSAAVPIVAFISTLLLATVSSLFCEQLHGLMILSVVMTTSVLAAQQFRGNDVVTSTYYADGRLQTVTDGLNNTTRYAYDVDNNITTVTYPDGGVEVMQYNAAGYLLQRTDPLNRVTTFTYDADFNVVYTQFSGSSALYVDQGGRSTRKRNRSKWARPYIWRLMNLRRLTCPSV